MTRKIFKGELITGDLQENIMTFEIEGEMSLISGKYAIVPIEEYEKGEDSFTMLKSWFEESADGNCGTVFMAECPNCGDAVVYNDGCVKCEANFVFK